MKLYIIGNGFDLHHGLKTGYLDYKKYLEKNNPALLKAFCSFPYLTHPEDDYELWTDLETSLTFDYQGFSSEYFSNLVEEKYPNLTSDTDYTWDEIATETDVMTEFIHDFTGPVFYNWLSQIQINSVLPDAHLDLSIDSRYVTFNYTSTLETVYHLAPENIFHIHGYLDEINPSDLLSGSSIIPTTNTLEYEVVEPIRIPPINNHTVRSSIQFGSIHNNPNDIREFFSHQFQSDDYYGASIEPAVEHIFEFCTASSKDLSSNYDVLKGFIDDDRIDEIVVMGHSFDGIDSKYYTDILFEKFKHCKWVVYYHVTDPDEITREEERIRCFFTGLNLSLREW